MSHEPPRPISIWQPTTADGEPAFARPEPGPFGDHYSDRRVIPRRCRRRHRLCLLGESAAAGYLLAPHLTPAKALGRRLGADWDVVDLARTNERLDSLAATAEAACQLAPDRLVVFTGNNWALLETPEWSPYAPSTNARREYARRLREGDLAGPARAAADALRAKVESALSRLAALRIPLTLVIPEVNLADWESPQPVAWLPGDGVARWYSLLAAARRALANGDLRGARSLGLDLLRLDGGGVPTGYRLLSRISARLGEPEDARTAARTEVDSVRYAAMALLPAPQATASAQELLRQGAARHGFSTVDLPAVFGRQDRLPGRALFYDYCHLTPKGIDLAMSAVAETLGADGKNGPSRLPARVRATAELGAAIHGVHRGLEGDLVRHWLGRALETDPRAAEFLLDLVSARAAPVPAVLTPRQLRAPWLGHQHGWRWGHLDAEVIAATGEILGWKRVAPRLGPARVELWSPLDRFYPEAMDHEEAPPLFLRSPWPWTAFALVATGGGASELEIVARLPAAAYPHGGRVELRHPGGGIHHFELGPSWTRRRLPGPTAPGLHKIVFHWPPPTVAGEQMLGRAIDRLESGRQADIHPVFAEILDLRIAG